MLFIYICGSIIASAWCIFDLHTKGRRWLRYLPLVILVGVSWPIMIPIVGIMQLVGYDDWMM